MAYVYEKLTELDVQTIIADERLMDSVKTCFAVAMKGGGLPRAWAINNERNAYLVTVPSIVREDSYNARFIFFYNKKHYFLEFQMAFDDKLNLIEGDGADIPLIEQDIKDAFSVYGRYGTGSEKVNPYFGKGE